jgi:hypothetical protein
MVDTAHSVKYNMGPIICKASDQRLSRFSDRVDFGSLNQDNYETCKLNNEKRLLIIALPKNCLKFNNEGQIYHFCQQSRL